MTAADQPLLGRRILVIVENLPVPFDRRVWQEALALTVAGAEVSVICPATADYPARQERLDGIDIHRHPLPAASGRLGFLAEYAAALFWQTVLAVRIRRGRGFDTIHGCSPPDLIFLVALLFKPFGARYIFDHHDLSPELYEAKFRRRGLFWRLLRLAERLTFRTADVSLATNESYRRIAIERGGMAPERVFVVRSAPDLRRVGPRPPNAAWRADRRLLVGYVGNMAGEEGIDLLLEAVARLGRDDVQLCLAGDGPAVPAMKRLAESLGLGTRVTFAGRLPDDDLFEMLSTADVCVNPDRVSPFSDASTMNKVLEYMAVGRPIVMFETTEGRFSAGNAALYAAPNDPADFAAKLAEPLDDPGQRARMGAAGRRRLIEDLGWDRSAAALIAAYRAL
jgi:glycosyltransferase involved in cell wall biosynthesis